MNKMNWKKQEETVKVAMAELADRGFRGISVIEDDGWHSTEVRLYEGEKLERKVPEGGWIAVIGDIPAAAYAMACRKLGLVDEEYRKVINISPVYESVGMAERLAEAGVVIAYHEFLRTACEDLLGDVCEWRELGRGSRAKLWVRKMKPGHEQMEDVFPEVDEAGELAVVAEFAKETAPSGLRRVRQGKTRLAEMLERLYCGEDVPEFDEGLRSPNVSVAGPPRTAAGRAAVAKLGEVESRKLEWRSKAKENGLALVGDFFSEGTPEEFAEIAELIGVGDGEPADAQWRAKPTRWPIAGRLTGVPGAFYDAPSKSVMDALEGLAMEHKPGVYRVGNGGIARANVFAASKMETGGGKRAAIAFVPASFVFSTWLDIAVALGKDRSIEWWYSVTVDEAGGWRFECPDGCEVALDLAGVASGEDWLAGMYETREVRRSARRPRRPRMSAGSQVTPRAMPELTCGAELDEEQGAVLAYGRWVSVATRIVANAASWPDDLTPSQLLEAAGKLVPVLTFGREEFPVKGMPDGMDETRVAAAAALGDESLIADGSAGLAVAAATLWKRELTDCWGLRVAGDELDERADRVMEIGRRIGLEAGIEALYSGVSVEDIVA